MSKTKQGRVWLVMGRCGDYEDQEMWIVAAFTSNADAHRWRELAADYAEAFRAKAKAWNDKHEDDENWPKGRPNPSRRIDGGLTRDRAHDVLYMVTATAFNPTAPAREGGS